LGARPPHARIEITDNGIGFDNKYKEQIFTIFQRLHGRLEYEGTGVGLATVRKIVERHGGSIDADGRPGMGATFIIDLPLRQIAEEVSAGAVK
jgi:signal transduction histidine kinase